MNILYATGMDSTKYGGIERMVVNLAYKLSGDNKFYVQYESMPGDADFCEDLKRTGAKIVILNTSGNKAKVVLDMLSFLRKNNIDLVHTNFSPAKYLFAIAARLAGVKKIISHFRNMETGPSRTGIKKFIVLTLSTSIIAVSEAVRQELIQSGADPFKVKVIHNGTCVPGQKPDKVLSRKDLGLNLTTVVVVSVAWDGYVKGVDLLLKAAGSAISSGCNINVLILGSADRNKSNAELAEILGIRENVFFTGITNKVGMFMDACDIYVQPSRSEACSRSILEAMSRACPVVAFDVGGNRELVDAGVTGLLARPGDFTDMGLKIKKLAENISLAREMGSKARERVLRLFTLDREVENVIESYNRPGNLRENASE